MIKPHSIKLSIIFCLFLFFSLYRIFPTGKKDYDYITGTIVYIGNSPLEKVMFKTQEGELLSIEVLEKKAFNLEDLLMFQGNKLELCGFIETDFIKTKDNETLIIDNLERRKIKIHSFKILD